MGTMTTSSSLPAAAGELHVTFLYHCAFVRSAGARRTDVLLSPGADHEGHALHYASLRIPAHAAPGLDDQTKHPGLRVEPQKTERLTRNATGAPTFAATTDLVWNLEGYDIWLAPEGEPSGASFGNQHGQALVPRDRATVPANVLFSTSVESEMYVIANVSTIGRRRIDPVLTEDSLPEFMWTGARVRIWGGRLRCGIPQGNLRHRRWDLGGRGPVGLSDRMEYTKTINGGTIPLFYKRLDSSDPPKRLDLVPDAQGVRIHITNDPFLGDSPHGSREDDPCEVLPHFASYSLLLEPAGSPKDLHAPPLIEMKESILSIPEGDSFCCPCGGGTP